MRQRGDITPCAGRFLYRLGHGAELKETRLWGPSREWGVEVGNDQQREYQNGELQELCPVGAQPGLSPISVRFDHWQL